eukprot:scaffold558818_cov29-Prasinocladus_malaysianus.AAC.1
MLSSTNGISKYQIARVYFSEAQRPYILPCLRFDLGGGPEDLIDFRAGRDVLVEGLVARYPAEEDGIRRYMKAVEGAANGTNAIMWTKLLPYNMPGRLAVSNWLAKIAQGYGRRTAKELVNEYVTDPELRALLAGGQMIDWNLAPDKVKGCCGSNTGIHP